MSTQKAITAIGRHLCCVASLVGLLLGSAAAAEPVKLRFWTWTPAPAVYAPAIQRFEQLNPGVRVELVSLDSKTLQEKVPLALNTGEAVDVVGVQPHMARAIAEHLLDLDLWLDKVEPGWRQHYNPRDLEDARKTSGGSLRYLALLRYGSVVGYYNVDLFKRLGLQPPRTLAEFEALAETLRRKSPRTLPAVINGKDGWTLNELLFTLMSQRGGYYNDFVYRNASLDAPPVRGALADLRQLFERKVFSLDVLDFDYGRAQELFTNGSAATYFQGSWESWLLSPKLRADRKVEIGAVGVFRLPVVAAASTPALRSFIEVGAGVSRYSRQPELAARFVAFMQAGEGADLLARHLVATFGRADARTDPALLPDPFSAEQARQLSDWVAQPAADRYATPAVQSFTGFDKAVSDVIQGRATPEAAARSLAERWSVHQRKTQRRRQ